MNLRLITLFLGLLASQYAFAEKADRDKPLQLEANKISIDDAKKIQVLEGNVVLIKGTIILKANRVVVTEDQYGFKKGTAFGDKGNLARFRQKREGREEYIDGEAERIEYDTNNEVLELFHHAWIKNGEDQLKGDYIWYDTVSEKYLVTASDNHDPKAAPPRVRATIQPKSKGSQTGAPSARGEQLELQGAGGLANTPARE
jgi:lipopolysaccharide export system protein LptA